MPTAPLRPCAQPQCSALVPSGYCEAHKAIRKEQEKPRPTSTQRGYGSRWQKARAGYLRSHSLCVACTKEHRITSASVVDHIQSHKGDMTLFWSPDNWQALCKRHHDVKTAKEDGGWGNPCQ